MDHTFGTLYVIFFASKDCRTLYFGYRTLRTMRLGHLQSISDSHQRSPCSFLSLFSKAGTASWNRGHQKRTTKIYLPHSTIDADALQSPDMEFETLLALQAACLPSACHPGSEQISKVPWGSQRIVRAQPSVQPPLLYTVGWEW